MELSKRTLEIIEEWGNDYCQKHKLDQSTESGKFLTEVKKSMELLKKKEYINQE